MKKRAITKCAGYVSCLLAASIPLNATAAPKLTGGVWWVYQYAEDNAVDKETGGEFADPAFVVYANDGNSYGPWHFSAEARWGKGAFSDPANNNSGDTFAMHQAWIGYDLNDDAIIKVGKSQVPFGWKTANFWPGDGLEGGYGDQMDVGIKLSSDISNFHYDVAYYHQDDFGAKSTDTLDDNKHWGSSLTYRKIKTGVVNGDWTFLPGNTFGVSYQKGRLQDLASASPNDNGRHEALDIHYLFEMGDFAAKYRFIDTKRDFSGMDLASWPAVATQPADNEVETQRHIAELGYTWDHWYFYVDGGTAKSKTQGNDAQGNFYSPGVSYKYGPGWIYLEYLWQNADIDRNGDVSEGDFRATYVSFDFYF
ncbi:hypothetical protein A11A3_02107 [Alcanivorax hongdengensis A-11-3]|uniref:Porin n=1 Tax=Alcanivorax hongdengensis A-11-3 TaxID=1177179 RepID=L0WFY1_9GAMM|nr:hypothetical protein [Alcanivorax hongdengensis]EKF75624.1 hypothetical protein A11A3_02107 [Alcanivorax hongdengensis A-11-3]